MALSKNATFDSHNPVTNDVIASHEIYSEEAVKAAVERARGASQEWRDLGFSGRRKVLLKWSSDLLTNIDSLSELVSLETGKPTSDAKLEAALAAGHIAWAARHAESVMRTSHRSPGLLMANMSATVERSPVGVVGVIGPWNYPVFTPLGSIAYALAAGNTVVFKPSEFTPGVGEYLAQSFIDSCMLADIFTCITGLGETGKFLCESGVDKLAFTGSTRTAKIVAATCAAHMTPVVLECGGKDPVIVAHDADLKRAADATVWSAFSNAGQTCIGAERVYVDERVADSFIEKVLAIAKDIHPGAPGHGKYGPSTMPKQIPIIQSHIDDAIARGATVLMGGSDSVKAPFVEPVIFCDVPEDSIAMTEETFGPIAPCMAVSSMDQALEIANSLEMGLAGFVFTNDMATADWLTHELQAGSIALNCFTSPGADAPFGGYRESGIGREGGPEMYQSYTVAKTIAERRVRV